MWMHGRSVQPNYQALVRLGPRRWGMTVRTADGRKVVHELLGRPRLDTDRLGR
ncbi:MAG TPA: hypothetical protein VH760_05980 [Gaiellaceae bacterium]|jgi:hypothetical protein